MTQIYLIRHGEAEGNIYRRFHGWHDTFLTGLGLRQLEYLKKKFESIHVDVCYASDLTRASQTAQAVYVPKGLKLQQDPAFRELYVGTWEDAAYSEIFRGELYEHTMDFTYHPETWTHPEAETYQQYTQRFIDAMTRYAMENDGKTMVITCHSAGLRGVLMRLFYNDRNVGIPSIDNTSVTHITYENGKYTANFIADNSHLPQEFSHIAEWRAFLDNLNGKSKYIRTHRQLLQDHIYIRCFTDEEEVGRACISYVHDNVGEFKELELKPEYSHMLYQLQVFGEAVSYYRSQSAKAMLISDGVFPQEVLDRAGVVDGRMQLYTGDMVF